MQAHNDEVFGHKNTPGTQVWLYLDRLKDGYAKKLAYLWHRPFRVLELVGDHAVRLESPREGVHVVSDRTPL